MAARQKPRTAGRSEQRGDCLQADDAGLESITTAANNNAATIDPDNCIFVLIFLSYSRDLIVLLYRSSHRIDDNDGPCSANLANMAVVDVAAASATTFVQRPWIRVLAPVSKLSVSRGA